MLVVAALLVVVFVPMTRAAEMSEQEKALANPYPNDFGPAILPEAVLNSYPANIRLGYEKLLSPKNGCAQCHSAARPLNSHFVEPEGGLDVAKQDAALAKLKKDQAQLFTERSTWRVETKIWSRFVIRMMNKPGCNLQKTDAKAIYEFLCYDSLKRKTGANATKWAAHRKGLVDQLKKKNIKRYNELKAAKDL